MARRRHSAASRDSGAARLVRWLLLALAGAGGGMILGEQVVGTRTNGLADEVPSFSSLSANPDAARQQDGEAPACTDCADSYGVTARLRALHKERMGDEFRELGAVDVDPPVPADPVDDDYRYGGRFPDPAPRPPERMTGIEETMPVAPAVGPPPAGEPPRPTDDQALEY